MAAFKRLRPAILSKKRLWHRSFPVNFLKFSKNTFFTEHVWATAFILREGRRLKQTEISIISKLHKENNNHKKCSYISYFLLVVLILFLFGLQFLQRGLMFQYIHTFIMFKHAEFGKHTWIHTSKIKKAYSLKNFIRGWSVYTSFFLFFIPGWNSIPFLHLGMNSKRHFTIVRMKFHA